MSETIKQWIGIDVSQDNLDIAIYPQNSTCRVTNDELGRAELVLKLAAYDIGSVSVLVRDWGKSIAIRQKLDRYYQKYRAELVD